MKLGKRYRLKKDLPTFKAGEIFELFIGNLYKVNESSDDTEFEVMAYHSSTLERFPNILTDWFEPIEPEPLIKDEKVRKAVRAWAEANKTITMIHVMSNGYELYGGNTDSVIHFETLPFGHIRAGDYTIDELCGEEECES